MDRNQKKNSRCLTKFQFCEVCKLNHNQGRQHIYFPNHKTSLRSLLTRFQSKLSDVKFFLKNPIPVRSEHAHVSRLWCVFCNLDILELDSPFACGNTIEHLASEEHWKRVKRFMGKHGGGLDSVDSFRVSDVDLSKWEKKCKSLMAEVPKIELGGSAIGPSNNIHNEFNADSINSFHENYVISLDFNIANDVVPLQRYTNERVRISCSELPSSSKCGSSNNPCEHAQVGDGKCLKIPKGCVDDQGPFHSLGTNGLSYGYHRFGSVPSGVRTTNVENKTQGLLNLTQISLVSQEGTEGNVHTGAPPPWFDATQGSLFDTTLKPDVDSLTSRKRGKSSKLNPNRVGAAWAERRKLELELEKRGELFPSNFDANWLPNFGRVWQSGTRKESRKEFQMENKVSHKEDSQSESCMPLQPYISKRMRRDTSV